ncbi:EAL domain-containing protein [uncultured Marinobacter sp.]|uniref:EAL domain-containing response regulator n=1 Tax=uncultured Marinobacter sp. TaxID=187379 RepID=UPI0030DB32AF
MIKAVPAERFQKTQRILVADDNPRLLQSLAELLRQQGYDTVAANGGQEACDILCTQSFDLAMIDLNMPEVDGFDVMDAIHRQQPDCALIVVSGETSFRTVSRALRRGAADYIRKPFDPDELLATLDNVMGKQSLLRAHDHVQRRLEHSESLHRYIVNSSPDIVFMLDSDGRFCFLNRKVENLLGHRHSELIGRDFRILLDQEDALRSSHALKDPGITAERPVSFEVRLRTAGSLAANRHFEITAFPIDQQTWNGSENADEQYLSRHARFYGTARDITERKEAEAFISFQAYHDLLTRLPNRALFRDRLNLAMTQARRNSESLAVMFLDLDRFKIINDTLGHSMGDRLLQAVTQRLERCLRKGDTLSRFGGDEFTLLLPTLPGREEAARIATKLIDTLKAPFRLDNHDIFIGVSIGIALFPEAGEHLETLIRNADIAMYNVKARGKDGYCFFDPSMSVDTANRLDMERDLRRALAEGEMKVHYQPQICLGTGRVSGLEALVRWEHPIRGLLYPAEFLPLASETNLISELSQQVLTQACEEAGRWIRSGNADLRLAVNLSPIQLEHPGFVDNLMSQLRTLGFPPANLEIEITENVIMNDLEQVSQKLRELAGQGIRIAIDDFGTGYSSLNYLHHLPIHTLKIDRSFVQDIRSGNDGACIVNAIVAMAHGLRLEIVAEGVENQEQLDYLADLGCEHVQGYYCGKPQPAEVVQALLAREVTRAAV